MKKGLFFLIGLFIISTAVSNTSFAAIVKPVTNTVILPGNPDPAKVKAATDEFKNLSKKEKKERIKDVKALIRHYKAAKKSGEKADTNTLLLCILAIILPPLAVYLYEGEINSKFWISLLLTLIFWVPGVIYALVVILGADK
ncbi:MAG TPA: YqaE/Pmp3 family membrane protein [Chitinophagaceae bacterium]|nr:YqaE/Pmp3 family membrane protein [Chitinophagaceae bacterium]